MTNEFRDLVEKEVERVLKNRGIATRGYVLSQVASVSQFSTNLTNQALKIDSLERQVRKLFAENNALKKALKIPPSTQAPTGKDAKDFLITDSKLIRVPDVVRSCQGRIIVQFIGPASDFEKWARYKSEEIDLALEEE